MAGIVTTTVKKGAFTLQKSKVKVLDGDGKSVGKGSFTIKGKIEGKRLTGRFSAKVPGCSVKGINLDAGG